MQFSIHRVPATGDVGQRIRERRQKRRTEIDLAHQRVCDDVLKGRVTLAEIDKNRVDLVRLQDDIAQVGQGLVADRTSERPGRADVGVTPPQDMGARARRARRRMADQGVAA